MSLFQACFDVGGHTRFSRSYGLLAPGHQILCENGKRVYIFQSKTGLEKYLARLERVCLSPAAFQKIQTEYRNNGKKLWKASQVLEKNFSKTAFSDFCEAEYRLAAGLFITTSIGRHMGIVLREALTAYFPKKSEQGMDRLLSVITYPATHTPLFLSQKMLLQVGALMQKKSKGRDQFQSAQTQKLIRKYMHRFSFIPVNFNEEPWSVADIEKQIRDLMRHSCAQQLKILQHDHLQRVQEQKTLLRTIRNPKIRQLAKVLQAGTSLNEYRKYIFCRASLAYRPFFASVAKEHGLSSWKDLWKLTPTEVSALAFQKKRSALANLSKREWSTLKPSTSADGFQVTTKGISSFIKAVRATASKTGQSSNVQVLKGMAANSGKVQGRVCVVLGREDFGKFRDGNILVAVMTSVDYVPLMQRAAAFVTDEGGITSHASILSREINKPCIIGTRYATKVLKDRDMVEVDAEKGIVTKLS